MAISEKLNYLLETKSQIKSAIEQKGVSIADTDSFRSYATKIGQIETGEGTTTPSIEDWQPEPDWWDIETILENDTEDYERKAIFLLTDELDDSKRNFVISGFEKYKLSDGQEFETTQALDITSLFDVSKDKVCSKGYQTRYVIAYTNFATSIMIKVPMNCISLVFDNIKFTYTGSWSNSTFYDHYYLQSVIFKNGTIYDMTSFSSLFNNCYSLQNIVGLITEHATDFSNMLNRCYSLRKMPQINTSNGTNFSNMFNGCNSLREILPINTSKGTSFSSMFSGCYSLREIPELDTNKGTNFSSMFSTCYSLKKIPQLNTSNSTNLISMFSSCNALEEIPQINTSNSTNFSSMFSGCYALKEIPELDTSKGTSFVNIFNNCNALINIKGINHITGNQSVSTSAFLNHSSLLRILNALVDLTGQTTQKLTLGSINLAKLTEEEKAIATEKNWTLS